MSIVWKEEAKVFPRGQGKKINERQESYSSPFQTASKGKMQDDSLESGTPGIPQRSASELLPSYRALMLARYWQDKLQESTELVPWDWAGRVLEAEQAVWHPHRVAAVLGTPVQCSHCSLEWHNHKWPKPIPECRMASCSRKSRSEPLLTACDYSWECYAGVLFHQSQSAVSGHCDILKHTSSGQARRAPLTCFICKSQTQ